MNVLPLLRLLRLDPCARYRRRIAAVERRMARWAAHAAHIRSRSLVRQPGFTLATHPRFKPGVRVFVRRDGSRLAAVSGLHLTCLFPLPPVTRSEDRA